MFLRGSGVVCGGASLLQDGRGSRGALTSCNRGELETKSLLTRSPSLVFKAKEELMDLLRIARDHASERGWD